MLGELTVAQIEEVLNENFIGRIGCRDGDKIYILPISYRYDYGMVLCHSYVGNKIEVMRQNPDICFEVEEVYSFHQWKTVMGWGVYEELTQEADIEEAKRKLSAAMLRQKALLSAEPPTEIAHQHHHDKPLESVYYRIRFNEWSGRFEKLSHTH